MDIDKFERLVTEAIERVKSAGYGITNECFTHSGQDKNYVCPLGALYLSRRLDMAQAFVDLGNIEMNEVDFDRGVGAALRHYDDLADLDSDDAGKFMNGVDGEFTYSPDGTYNGEHPYRRLGTSLFEKYGTPMSDLMNQDDES